jgi:transcription antitermination factor NusG
MTGARNEGRWCILRCSGAKTLELAASLNDAGFEAWAPVETVVRKTPDRKKLFAFKSETIVQPIMPGYVFARLVHLAELLELARSPSLQYRIWDSNERRMVTKGHPAFRFMHNLDGGISCTPDGTLNSLRSIERKRKPRGKVVSVPVGTSVRLDDGTRAGLVGTVERVEGKFALVAFPGLPMPVKIAMWMLHEEEQLRAA